MTPVPRHGNAVVQRTSASQAASERSDPIGGEGEEPSQAALLEDLRRAAMEQRAAAATAAAAAAAKGTAVPAYDPPSEGGGGSSNLLLKKPESGGMDWGVVAIYSCEASCAESEEEFVVVQAPID